MESQTLPEQEIETQWLNNLSEFIVEANKNTWASEGALVETPERPEYTELEYKRDEWKLRDSFTGHFSAPGMTTVYYKERPAWTMSYGGKGQTEGYHDRADETFQFLRTALMQVTPQLPIRGPERYKEGNKTYAFKLLSGGIKDGIWMEEIREDGVQTFSQAGIIGIVVAQDENGKPILPWKF